MHGRNGRLRLVASGSALGGGHSAALTVFLGRRSPADEDEGRTHGRVGTRGRAPHERAGCDRGPSERSAPAACWSVRAALSAQTQADGTVVVAADGIGGEEWPAR